MASQICLRVRDDPSTKHLDVEAGYNFQAVPVQQLLQLLDTPVRWLTCTPRSEN